MRLLWLIAMLFETPTLVAYNVTICSVLCVITLSPNAHAAVAAHANNLLSNTRTVFIKLAWWGACGCGVCPNHSELYDACASPSSEHAEGACCDSGVVLERVIAVVLCRSLSVNRLLQRAERACDR
uniref:Secreted protein n=1 Tax=Candidatus Hodgkinia cicadicola TaxID=573658 RepID=A0A097GZU7_9HYPH|nr:hypothetical protein HCTETAUR2_008 [Candidatus Hodgkinia cicadicola]